MRRYLAYLWTSFKSVEAALGTTAIGVIATIGIWMIMQAVGSDQSTGGGAVFEGERWAVYVLCWIVVVFIFFVR